MMLKAQVTYSVATAAAVLCLAARKGQQPRCLSHNAIVSAGEYGMHFGIFEVYFRSWLMKASGTNYVA